MGAIEELVAALAGKQAEANIAAENPYLKFAAIPEALSGTVIKGAGTGNYSTDDIFKSALMTGLTQGILGGIGEDYQNTLTDKYQSAVKDAALGKVSGDYGLSPSLFRKATDAGSIFKLQNDFETKSEGKKLVFGALSKADTPDQQRMILDAAQKAGYIDATDNPARLGSSYTEDTYEPKTREDLLVDEIGSSAERLRLKYGGTRGQALETASQAFKAKRDEIDRQYKKIEEAQTQADALNQIVAKGQNALDQVGYTGKGGGLAQGAAGWLGLGIDSQKQKFTAGQMLESLKADIVQMGSKGYKGSMSDREFSSILQSGPELTKSPEANKKILDNWRYAANVQQQYVDFMTQARDEGAPVYEAEKAWREIKKQNPFMINGEINKFWLGEDVATTSPEASSGSNIEAQIRSQIPQGSKVTKITRVR